MEKFYIATEESKLRKEYFDWKENLETVNKVVKEFFESQGIETSGYYADSDELAIEATENDAEKFKTALIKRETNGLRFFKKNSKINKEWIEMLKEKNLRILHKPYLGFIFHVCRKFTTRLFDYKDKVYCSMNAEHNFENPEGLEEIKASDFYKIIEEIKANEGTK